MAVFPFGARICPFQRRRFPFACGVVPFKGEDSLWHVDLSLSTTPIPIRAQICPFQRRRFPFVSESVPFNAKLLLKKVRK